MLDRRFEFTRRLFTQLKVCMLDMGSLTDLFSLHVQHFDPAMTHICCRALDQCRNLIVHKSTYATFETKCGTTCLICSCLKFREIDCWFNKNVTMIVIQLVAVKPTRGETPSTIHTVCRLYNYRSKEEKLSINNKQILIMITGQRSLVPGKTTRP